MAEDTDFAALYHTLGITPACTPGQFRQAYRRAVARLHPDQRGGHGDVSELQELNRLYRAAVKFQRAHGRLPGAAPPAADARPAAAFASAAVSPDEAPAEDKAGIDRMSRYFILPALLAIQGAPLGMHETRWDYGPSWVDFGCGGMVTDWHSSPLRPLRVATPHPAARDRDAFDAAQPPGCL